MSNKQKTPVEWLESRITVLIPDDIGSQLMYKNNIKKAKEMDKENMIEFAYNALKIADNTTNRYVDVDELYDKLYGENTHEQQ
jgi:hypothetical protein